VPIKVKESSVGGGLSVGVVPVESALGWDDWIECPQGRAAWSRNVKAAENYVLVYYGTTPVPAHGARMEDSNLLVQLIGDVLFIKVWDGVAVDVDDQDVQDVVQDIEWMF
jgi:hypothetical protein